ncbi:MAG: hypothetical protein CGU28_08790 [Candidatus Dactylopiibacterium carminicum]|uniref:Flagellar hook-length control protein FliK n=1 Tax=Candidatus Dactylopiibacterium carminicum TaxID=857335 RepID=A0A272EWF8_9RHOO|nr:flagellar hook-length control protein FliK [Candidatus Dactylopiibacterium carminicum]KAF7599980.1 flagellar hook-length control protein FliK [Candidatus Dactylopiibacterium carminicum]PAS94439.1 MAG: hypothetical protein CGU29_03770 [Candidatus Dactylopiibacterium carminicum]PAS96400.1 MAG: hypothetical protein CGU28_08790 [Candidatus Dactylopiibacterium carminicum]PAS99982.1 MAG: hypothetical protein BSR46_05205 [Candidatus Dactylopiibacterium carminicum]
MALERIANVTQARPVSSREGGARQASVVAGETLRLAYAETLGEDLLVTTGDGRPMRLIGMGRLGQGLAEGDILLMKVLSVYPELELELQSDIVRRPGARAAIPFQTEQAAMRVDQAVLRQFAWRAPDGAALALSWRALVQGRWQQAMFQPSADIAAYQGQAPAVPMPGLEEEPFDSGRWTFPIYALGGVPMLLRLVHSDPDGNGRDTPRRSMRSLALRIELTLGQLGRIVLQVQWLAGGIQLSLATERKDALAPLSDALPDITTALARAGLRLMRCSMSHGLPGFETDSALAARLPQGPAAALPPSLFRAAAEVVVQLANRSHALETSRGSEEA